MDLMIAGLLIFFAVHLIPSVPILRQILVSKIRIIGYKLLFSGFSFAGFYLIVAGKIDAEFVELWQPPGWGRLAAIVIMFPALVSLVCAYVPTNLRRITRHPMLWGVTFWGLAHLLANGDLSSVVLFGGFAVFSLFDMWSENRRGAEIRGKPLPLKNDAIAVGAGAVAYGLLLYAHPYFFGVPAIGG